MNICVIGAGAYGCYAVDLISKIHPSAFITIIEVGDSTIRSEKEMGLLSILKKHSYSGLSKGRFFGFGGSTDRWGGQLLNYSSFDFSNPNLFMKQIVELNEKYKQDVFSTFGLKNIESERAINEVIFIKTGVWLSVFKRNFFKFFKITTKKKVHIISNARVSKLEFNGKKILGVYFQKDGIEKKVISDFFFLTVGAFETARLMLSSGLINGDKVFFSDHLSQKAFKINGSTYIGKDDFLFKLDGLSLITKRIIGEVNDNSFYIHPVFNTDNIFFQNLKLLLFKRQHNIRVFFCLLRSLPDALRFFWSVFYHKKLYISGNEWHLYIDIDNPSFESYVELSSALDRYGVNGLNVCYSIGSEAVKIFEKAKNEMLKYLKLNKVDFEVLMNEIDIDSIEDIYHPHGMFEFEDLDTYFNQFENLLMVNTGVLPRSGGINPTAALFPILEEFIRCQLKSRI